VHCIRRWLSESLSCPVCRAAVSATQRELLGAALVPLPDDAREGPAAAAGGARPEVSAQEVSVRALALDRVWVLVAAVWCIVLALPTLY
jgi:hypothetical protein